MLPPDDTTTAGPGNAARARRDAAVRRFTQLRAAVESGDRAPLLEFHARAAALVAPRLASWRSTWERGPRAEAERTGSHLDALAAGDATHLANASVHAIAPPGDERRYGCCGTLGTYVV